MKILHFYHPQQPLQAQYVQLLMESADRSAGLQTATTLAEVRQALQATHYDILHIHGCWSWSYAKATKLAARWGTRVVVSPHGQLEPWILKDRRWKEKWPKTLAYQRRAIADAYTVIAMGRMERQSLEQLGWNPRIEVVRNAVVTHSITVSEMQRQLNTIYRKVLDSDVYAIMSPDNRQLMFSIFKCAVASHHEGIDPAAFSRLTQDEWRQMFIYAHYEQVEELLLRGIHLLGLRQPDVDTERINCYLPADYVPVQTISAAIGNLFASENERLLATFKYLRRQAFHRQLTVCHLLELEREIREHGIDEDLLAETLEEHHLLKFAQRLMGVLQMLTGIEEGIAPLPFTIDRQTRALHTMITNHLKI